MAESFVLPPEQEELMPTTHDNQTHRPHIVRPTCPTCEVPMWCMSIEAHPSGDAFADRQHFKCMACGASAVIPPLN